MLTSKWIFGQEDITQPLTLREQVFGKENEKRDALDDFAWHAVFYIDDVPAGTGRIAVDGTDFYIGKICMLPQFRSQYAGDLLSRLLIYKACKFANVIHVNSPQEYIPFFSRYGFTEAGEGPQGTLHMSVAKDKVTFPSKCGHDCAEQLVK